jgi:transposase
MTAVNKRLRPEVVVTMRRLRSQGALITEISRATHVSRGAVHRYCRGWHPDEKPGLPPLPV